MTLIPTLRGIVILYYEAGGRFMRENMSEVVLKLIQWTNSIARPFLRLADRDRQDDR